MPTPQHQTVELDVTTVAHGGIFIARHEGRVVFVTDALPGERVLARLTDTSKSSFWRAETVQVLDPSPHRVEHLWAEASLARDPAERAGGAEFGHIALAEQRELKGLVLREALQRFAGLESDVVVEAVPGEDPRGAGWRTRIRLQVDEAGRLGPFAARSHTVVPVGSLPLATEALQDAVSLSSRFEGVRTVDLVDAASGVRVFLDGRTSKDPIVERVGGRSFRLDEGGFWQVHRGAAERLSALVAEAADPDATDPDAQHLDLYGGVGLLAAALADRLGDLGQDDPRITSVESNPRAAAHAEHNLGPWPGAVAVRSDTLQHLRRLAGAPAAERAALAAGTIVLDPPRSGAGKSVVQALGTVGARQLIYVACDPVALARDLGYLAEQGYRLDGLRAVDLFPNTHHVEAVARLVRD